MYRRTLTCGIGLYLAAIAPACSDAAIDAEPVDSLSQELGNITISGKATTSSGSAIAGATITLSGSAQATRTTDANGNYSFTNLNSGSYSVKPTKTNCAFTPDVANLNNVSANKTQNFSGSGSGCAGTAAAAKALILIDSRLYQQLASTIDTYKSQVEARRGFGVDLRNNATFDDWAPATVRQYIKDARAANPAIEGVLFIGNIKLPSFYKTRQDIADTRLIARYYEDLDAPFTKRYADGEADPVCQAGATPDTKCIVSPRIAVEPLFDDGEGPYTTLRHDFDDTDFGPNRDPEIWAAFMPVGVAGSTNSYTVFADQLRPYFQKLSAFYNRQIVPNGRYYMVTNGLEAGIEDAWTAWGKERIDYYGKAGPNNETGAACIVGSQNVCYVRWATESYGTFQQWKTAYDQLNEQHWVGEGWQQASIYTQHMNNNLYDVAEDIVHSREFFTIVNADESRALTKVGLILGSGGCNNAGYLQPFAPAGTQQNTTALASQNVLVNYLYGSSKVLAAFGTTPYRVEYSYNPKAYKEMKQNGAYLGAAHHIRNKYVYSISGDKHALKVKGNEMLLGDPFMDLKP